MRFNDCEKVTETFWFCDLLIVKTVHLQQLKGVQSSKSRYVKGIPFFNIRYTKGVPFLCQKW